MCLINGSFYYCFVYEYTLVSVTIAGQVIFTSIYINGRTVCCSEPNVYPYLIFNEPIAYDGTEIGPELMAVEWNILYVKLNDICGK